MEGSRQTVDLDAERSAPLGVTQLLGRAARDAQALLDRALRAVALARVRVEDARRAWDRLDDTIARTRELSDELNYDSARLCGATGQVARLARAEGTPPERMVVLLKDIVARSALGPTLEAEIERQVIEWGIDAYYTAA